MALELNYTAASSNLPDFLTDWESNSVYRGNGGFNAVQNVSDQWYAGTRVLGGTPNDNSSVIVNGEDYSYTPGVVDGTVNTLELGSNLTYVSASDEWVQDEGLLVDFGGSPLTSAFDTAITDLSQNGSLTGLYAYFAEQGTIQNGTDGDDTMLSFAGDDEFTGGLGSDTFVFGNDWANDVIQDFNVGEDDVLDLEGIDAIGGYLDLIFNHSNWWDTSGTLTIQDGSNTLELTGFVGTDIFGLVWDGAVAV
ncbi:MAG: hypothetical protein COB78_12055 [Hyphomicrobiales bacterium]|nr:MAG: hypothetical protein COB78_12055 [Hyphomicrobiales bacterium]